MDCVQLDGTGQKSLLTIGARLVRRNATAEIEIHYSYMGAPNSSLQFLPAPPIPVDDCRHILAHNQQSSGQYGSRTTLRSLARQARKSPPARAALWHGVL